MQLNETCRWREPGCGACGHGNPFMTDVYCHAAITLYYANGNILCPGCWESYLSLDAQKDFTCPKCGFRTGYETILEPLMRAGNEK